MASQSIILPNLPMQPTASRTRSLKFSCACCGRDGTLYPWCVASETTSPAGTRSSRHSASTSSTLTIHRRIPPRTRDSSFAPMPNWIRYRRMNWRVFNLPRCASLSFQLHTINLNATCSASARRSTQRLPHTSHTTVSQLDTLSLFLVGVVQSVSPNAPASASDRINTCMIGRHRCLSRSH